MKGQRVVMLTEGAMTMPDMRNWSKDDALKVSEITGIPFEFQGDGYVKSQNVTKGTTINSKSKIRLKMVSPDKLDAFNKNNDHKSQSETKKETDVQENEGIGSLLNG
ncbi:PASTA domain [Listeria grayi]|uniref:PASTA domain n=1 Tax=Listeria grayi TaxID=1641 RepID=A0A378MJ94_LISGR|nr:PASTA domain [Listeria grayi]